MNDGHSNLSRRRVSAGFALAAAGLLLGGAAWRGLAADTLTAQTRSERAGTTEPVTRAVGAQHDSYADIVKIVSPAVVTIRVEGKARVSPTDFQGDELFRRFFGDQFDERQGPRIPRSFKQRGLGSGVIIGNDGYILTNHHVVDGADEIKVDFTDGRTMTAKVVGSDKASDLALVKVNASNLHALTLGNSDAVQVGDVVLAVGNPLGVGQTVTMGIISAKGRSTRVGDGGYEDFLQTDAPINHGNSGGALVNTKGELVGINSQIMSNTGENIGIGFAIPANMARHVADELRKDGRVRRAQLGVSVQPVTSDIAASLGLKEVGGAIISSVVPESAADRAGLKPGDVIQTFNGQSVNDTNALRNRVAETAPGASATVGIVRDGARRDVTVKLDEATASRSARREAEPATEDKASLGVSVAPVTPEVAARFRLPGSVKGLVVEDVNPDGRAADAGVQQGDVIQEVNRRPVRTVEELRTAVRSSADKPLLVLINREGSNVFLTVRPVA
jgi:Do/DeqQ family serine protease